MINWKIDTGIFLTCYKVAQNNKIINNNGSKYFFLKLEQSKESKLYHGWTCQKVLEQHLKNQGLF